MREVLEHLRHQHDEHQKETYSKLMAGEDATAHLAYGAGLLHGIRTMEDYLNERELT